MKMKELVCQQYIEGAANSSQLLKMEENQREEQAKMLKEALGENKSFN